MRADDVTAVPTAEDVEHWRREVEWRRRALTMRGLPLDTAQELHYEIDMRETAIRRAGGRHAPPRPKPRPVPKPVLPGSSKLTDEEVREVRRRYAAGGETRVSLAAAFGVGESTIGRVIYRQAYQHVEEEQGND